MSRWSIPLDRLAAKAKADIETVARRATFQVFQSVILASPVDTGRFRANWNISYQQPDATTTGSTTGSRGLQQAQQALRLPVGGVVYLTNGLPYARRLEYGYSKQAPSGMVRISAMRFSQMVERAAR